MLLALAPVMALVLALAAGAVARADSRKPVLYFIHMLLPRVPERLLRLCPQVGWPGRLHPARTGAGCSSVADCASSRAASHCSASHRLCLRLPASGPTVCWPGRFHLACPGAGCSSAAGRASSRDTHVRPLQCVRMSLRRLSRWPAAASAPGCHAHAVPPAQPAAGNPRLLCRRPINHGSAPRLGRPGFCNAAPSRPSRRRGCAGLVHLRGGCRARTTCTSPDRPLVLLRFGPAPSPGLGASLHAPL
ncbi:uncharacterized protein LOC123446367 [Hordeum vulgare subsp. vulgare]|uniref:Predicted protein n=1 Tax=Hordeum vulgare subsp. vulgare TaxID=112509 RepID=F2EEF9_HORVV|nr:uncharacterized protein LOC123446367 [Hordeum vulgare subsp. vulgare]BAK05731.1 predicted protein [Hordeum vulgare subsp. vulgare]